MSTDNVAQGAMYGGAGTAWVMFGLSINEWAVILSTAVAIAGGLVHIWVLLRKEKRDSELHRQRMEVHLDSEETDGQGAAGDP